jgi:hypothetical protein
VVVVVVVVVEVVGGSLSLCSLRAKFAPMDGLESCDMRVDLV